MRRNFQSQDSGLILYKMSSEETSSEWSWSISMLDSKKTLTIIPRRPSGRERKERSNQKGSKTAMVYLAEGSLVTFLLSHITSSRRSLSRSWTKTKLTSNWRLRRKITWWKTCLLRSKVDQEPTLKRTFWSKRLQRTPKCSWKTTRCSCTSAPGSLYPSS